MSPTGPSPPSLLPSSSNLTLLLPFHDEYSSSEDNEIIYLPLPPEDEIDMNMELMMGYMAMPIEISILLSFFFFLFIVGFVGNATVILRIVKTNRLFHQMYGKESGSRRMTTQRYVLLLACVDLFVTVQIPILFPYLYSGQWLIGEFMCNFFWIVDNVNKILSIHILTAMAIERYFIVLHSVRSGQRGRIPRIATAVWFVGTIISVLLLIPLLAFVDLDVMKIGHTTITTIGSYARKPPFAIMTFGMLWAGECVSPLPDSLFLAFLVYMFVLSYCVPAVIVTFCYAGLVRILKTRYTLTTPRVKESTKTHLIQKVSKSILCVTAFHFACWTPFWIVTLLPVMNPDVFKVHPRATMLAQMFTLTLPYVNCSFNWCFYVLLNKRLRKQIFRTSSSYISGLKQHTAPL